MAPKHRSDTVAGAAPRQRQTVLWIIAILLAIIATILVTQPRDRFGIQPAFGDIPMAGARGIYAFTGQIGQNRYGLFMMDVDNGTVWCYEYLPATRRLKLVAARSFLFDRYLSDYNCDEPTIEQVKAMLDKQRKVQARMSHGDTAPEEESALSTTDLDLPLEAEDEGQDDRGDE